MSSVRDHSEARPVDGRHRQLLEWEQYDGNPTQILSPRGRMYREHHVRLQYRRHGAHGAHEQREQRE